MNEWMNGCWRRTKSTDDLIWFVINASLCCVSRFEEYDGATLNQFVKMRREVPEVFYNALLKGKMSMKDVLKISCAIEELYY